jgi:rhamnose utilization protein RhaD (predicted bifunctional aldolase and dehydrogenase)
LTSPDGIVWTSISILHLDTILNRLFGDNLRSAWKWRYAAYFNRCSAMDYTYHRVYQSNPVVLLGPEQFYCGWRFRNYY